MATIEKTFLDLPGLQKYDRLIKALIPEADNITIEINEGKISVKNPPEVEGETLKL